jgi:phosphonate transport system substrate-binding protein
LKFTSCQAPSADPFVAELVRLIGKQLGIPTELVNGVPWKEREQQFDRGDIDVCWMCGWPYADRADSRAALELIAAPVMADPRYSDRPIYFSDVVVRADSTFKAFQDLRGASWAYNEPRSHSGYNVVRYFLALKKIDGGFFGKVVESGSHASSVDLIVSGSVDASAIDTTVLAAIATRRPEVTSKLRVIETIGPSPAPPWVMRSSLPQSVRDAVRRGFLSLHESAEGRAILQEGALQRFAAVNDKDYDPIREMAALAAATRL